MSNSDKSNRPFKAIKGSALTSIKVFFDPRQSARSNSSFSPSAQKPEQVVQFWIEQGHPIEIKSFDPVSRAQLSLVHDPEYVQSVLNCQRPNGFGNTNPDVAESLPFVAGSMVGAALYAFKTKESAFSPTSGAHHAGYRHGGGFCTFNHLILSALLAHRSGAQRIGLIDLDAHFGDGSQDIIDSLGLDFIEHYTFGRSGIMPGTAANRWLKKLPKILEKMADCDLLIFNAGVDPHVDDPLGGVLTTEQMLERDLIVYGFADEQGIPIVTSLAGGYQRDENGSIRPVLELHNNTMLAFCKAFRIGLDAA